mgnify:CR=1 FL=1
MAVANKKQQISVNDGVYAAILAIASITVLSTAIFVFYKCVSNYETYFKIVEVVNR